MPRKSGVAPSDITKWLNRIKRGVQVRDDADRRFGYSRSVLEYEGNYIAAMPSFVRNTDVVPINEVYGFVKTFIPSVYSRDPHISVNPKNAKSVSGAKILELALNGYWRELRLKQQVKRCILDAIFAEGWMKVGYSAAFGSIAKEKGEPAIEEEEFIKNEDIFASRVSWKNMSRDWGAEFGIHDARWVAEKIIKPLEAVRASRIYENTSKLEPSFVASGPDVPANKRLTADDQTEWIEMWEIWDRDTEKVYVVVDGHDGYLRNGDWPYDMDGFPYSLIRFNDMPDEPYAPNLISSWEPQLWEKIKIRSMQMDHIKRFSRQMTAEDGSLSPIELEKYKRGDTGAIIFHKKGRQPPQPIPYAQLQTDMYAVEGRIDLDKDNISGQPNAVRSAPQRTQSRTLGEIDRLISAFQARQSEPQDIVEDFSEEIAYKLIAVIQQHLPGMKFVRATQEDIAKIQFAFKDPVTGENRFDGTGFSFSKEDIQGIEFLVDVKSGSTLPMDRQNKIDSMVNILKLGATIGLVPGDKVTRVLGKNILSEFEMKEVEQAYEEMIVKLEAAEEVQRVGRRMQVNEVGRRIEELKSRGRLTAEPLGANSNEV